MVELISNELINDSSKMKQHSMRTLKQFLDMEKIDDDVVPGDALLTCK